MEGSSMPSAFRDWADLSDDVVVLISEKVNSIADYARFRAVCSPWRCATLPYPRHLPPQLPWLMLPWNSGDPHDEGIRLFYDPWESKTRELYLPDTIDTLCCASHRGWLLLVATEGAAVFLLNPLTEVCIQLPHIGSKASHYWPDPCYDDLWYDPFLGTYVIRKVVFSSDPTDPNCLITVFPQNCCGFWYCRVRDPNWVRVDIFPELFSDATYYNGRFYLLYGKSMEVIDLNNKRVVYWLDLDLGEAVSMSFLEGKSGVYMVAVHDADYDGDEATHDTKEGSISKKKKKFELYQIQEEPFKLNQVSDTRNTMVFCGNEVCPSLAVCSDDWDSIDGDCMYMECKGWSLPGKDGDGDAPSYNRYIAKMDNAKSDNGKSQMVESDIDQDTTSRPYAQDVEE